MTFIFLGNTSHTNILPFFLDKLENCDIHIFGKHIAHMDIFILWEKIENCGIHIFMANTPRTRIFFCWINDCCCIQIFSGDSFHTGILFYLDKLGS